MKPTVFIDLDGVLADFVRGSFRLHKRSLPMRSVRWGFPQQIGFRDEYDPAFWNPMGRDFWANLDVLADGVSLLHAAESMLPANRIGLLTSAAGVDGCLDGKRDWVGRHLPEYLPRFFTGVTKELFAAPGKILIDDREENVSRFVAEGGSAVLVPRPWNSRAWCCDENGSFPPHQLATDLRETLRKIDTPTVAS